MSIATPSLIQTPYGRECRKRDAIQAVRDRYHAQYRRLLSDMQAEIDEIENEYVFGKREAA